MSLCNMRFVICIVLLSVSRNAATVTFEFTEIECDDPGQSNLSKTGLQQRWKLPAGRAGSATWCDDVGNVWMFGGEGYGDPLKENERRLFNDTWLYNSTSRNWTPADSLVSNHSSLTIRQINMTSKPVSLSGNRSGKTGLLKPRIPSPSPRTNAVACGVPGIVFILFGGLGSGNTLLSDTWLYHISFGIWVPFDQQKQAITPPSNWTTLASWCIGNGLYVLRGQDGKSNQLWKFCLRSLTWSELDQQPVASSHSAYHLSAFPETANRNVITGTSDHKLFLYLWWLENGDNHEHLWWYSVNSQTWNFQLPEVRTEYWWITMPLLWSRKNAHDTDFSGCSNTAFKPTSNNSTLDSMECDRQYTCLVVKNESIVPNPRSCTSSWIFKNQIYIFGGRSFNNHGRVLVHDDIWTVDVSPTQSHTSSKLVSIIIVLSLCSIAAICLIGFCVQRTHEFYYGLSKSRMLSRPVRYTPLRDLAVFE